MGGQSRQIGVLSTADGRFSESLLLGKPMDRTRQPFKPEQISDQPVQVNIGSALDFSSTKGPLTIVLDAAFEAAGTKHDSITLHNKFYDQTAAPVGKSAITVFLDSSYDWWKGLADTPDRYREEKERCAKAVIDVIENQFPGFKESIEIVDVATPLTRERYTGNYMGAMQARKPNSSMVKALVQGSPRYDYRGIEGYYMASL
jgi:hypothetical protein